MGFGKDNVFEMQVLKQSKIGLTNSHVYLSSIDNLLAKRGESERRGGREAFLFPSSPPRAGILLHFPA